ncbi:MAG: L,D-transpeptidase family protein [Ignavibacteriaceae bacterium]|nr:L,D-transpeptidase family protein [Ignavibacterium sp.]MCC6255630.1 L,D-transpeptidase family protein [Ignavibacteriaceae bacterium]HRN25899.1 L,D-transpeptidase family protein [Ignavibacteriaceae bacterium]HRQ55491.1 L,D-transpeptidase family protein [Ignavibacteriaceae bacterium]
MKMVLPLSKEKTFFLIVVTLIAFIGCDKKIESVKPNLDEEFNFNQAEYEAVLEHSFSFSDTTDLLYQSIKENLDTLKSFYFNINFKPIFIKSYESKSFVDSLLTIIGKAEEHGLNPENYNYTKIKNEFSESIDPKTYNKKRYLHLANAEMLAANAILTYSIHMRHGVVNPRKIFAESYYLPVTDSLNQKLFEPFEQENIIEYLKNIQPKSEKYKKMQAALKRFVGIKDFEWTAIPVTDKKVEPGNVYPSIDLVINKLITLGFLDTSKMKINDLVLYDTLLTAPIKSFQRANGLNDDGIIGKTTIERLNITPMEYVDKIKLTLERFRWLDYSDTAKYILANIPDFKVYAMENGVEKFNIIICVGRKGKWETPNLYGQISYMVLNPTWSVPKSIIQEEIVSGLRRDSLYLKKRYFKVYKAGERVSLDGLTAHELSSSNRYSIVQDPGAGNALGKIKFMFKNPFGVYLHDTPTRAPFKYVNRAVSHGCLRVEKPMQLAEYLLNNNSNWTTDFIKIEVGQKVDNPNVVEEFNIKRSNLRKNHSYGVTTEVKFDRSIPLFVDYYTVWVDENGVFNYRDDVYDRDKVLRKYFLE